MFQSNLHSVMRNVRWALYTIILDHQMLNIQKDAWNCSENTQLLLIEPSLMSNRFLMDTLRSWYVYLSCYIF